MPVIDDTSDVLTLINVFTVTPEKQRALEAVLIQATHQTMRHLPGFVSASIHCSLDGCKVIDYAQWDSLAHFEAMRRNPVAIPHLSAAAALAAFEPILCRVAEAVGED